MDIRDAFTLASVLQYTLGLSSNWHRKQYSQSIGNSDLSHIYLYLEFMVPGAIISSQPALEYIYLGTICQSQACRSQQFYANSHRRSQPKVLEIIPVQALATGRA